jgi:hypothetical protein
MQESPPGTLGGPDEDPGRGALRNVTLRQGEAFRLAPRYRIRWRVRAGSLRSRSGQGVGPFRQFERSEKDELYRLLALVYAGSMWAFSAHERSDQDQRAS